MRDLNIPRSDFVIATKLGGRMAKGANDLGLSRSYVLRAAEASLKRLGTDYIDVFMPHFPDPATPIEETIRALDDLVKAGKVRYVGLSNHRAWLAQKAVCIAERWGMARPEILETHYSLATRDAERDVLPMAHDNGLGIMAYGALLGGVLSGKFTRQGDGKDQGKTRTGGQVPKTVDREKAFDAVDAIIAVAKRHNVKPAQVPLAWLLSKPVVTAALFGARRPEQVTDNIGATEIKLTEEDLKQLEAAAPPAELHDGITQNAMAMLERVPYAR
jgi:aryl-alcohol dehydrogenase-like predicted oxidoreductase